MTREDLDEFRFVAALSVALQKGGRPSDGNYTIQRHDGPYKVSVSDSVLKLGDDSISELMRAVSMMSKPRIWKSVYRFWVSRDGKEGSFFYHYHLIRWYIDFHDDKTPSLYVMIDAKSSWWDRVQYRLRNIRRSKELHRKTQVGHA